MSPGYTGRLYTALVSQDESRTLYQKAHEPSLHSTSLQSTSYNDLSHTAVSPRHTGRVLRGLMR